MASSSLASVLLLLLTVATATAAFSATSTASFTRIPLSKSSIYLPSSSNNLWESISHVARSSLARARHLKRQPAISGSVKLPTYPRSYGGYSMSLYFGTPPQPVSLVMDTGSSLVWTPCTTNRSAYSCVNCTFSGVDPAKIPTYKLNKSTTVQVVGCKSPKCRSIFGSAVKCPPRHCKPKQSNCTLQQRCPAYVLEYGLGSTVGRLVSDSLQLSKVVVKDFAFGCSVYSERQPEGIAGFGRGSASLPAQLGLTKFSYCLASHSFDDSPKTGDLVLYGNGNAAGGTATAGVSYAPFIKNPKVSPYSDYYYVALNEIIVGGKTVPLPSGFLVPSPKGNGGVIVDSGSTFTFMERAIHEPVARELEKQMSRYKRAKDIEDQSGLGPCYDVTGQKDLEIPKLVLLFNGGAKMDLPLANYFSFIGGPSVVCMTVLTDTASPVDPGVPSGPAMILGNYQQQNFYVEYDLDQGRFGFKPQRCDQAGN